MRFAYLRWWTSFLSCIFECAVTVTIPPSTVQKEKHFVVSHRELWFESCSFLHVVWKKEDWTFEAFSRPKFVCNFVFHEVWGKKGKIPKDFFCAFGLLFAVVFFWSCLYIPLRLVFPRIIEKTTEFTATAAAGNWSAYIETLETWETAGKMNNAISWLCRYIWLLNTWQSAFWSQRESAPTFVRGVDWKTQKFSYRCLMEGVLSDSLCSGPRLEKNRNLEGQAVNTNSTAQMLQLLISVSFSFLLSWKRLDLQLWEIVGCSLRESASGLVELITVLAYQLVQCQFKWDLVEIHIHHASSHHPIFLVSWLCPNLFTLLGVFSTSIFHCFGESIVGASYALN